MKKIDIFLLLSFPSSAGKPPTMGLNERSPHCLSSRRASGFRQTDIAFTQQPVSAVANYPMTVHVNVRPTLSQRHYTDSLVITPKPIKTFHPLPPESPCSFAVSPRNIWSFVKRYEHTYADPPENGPLASRLSQSFEVIGNDNDRLATYNFLLHSNHGQPCIISVINGNFG